MFILNDKKFKINTKQRQKTLTLILTLKQYKIETFYIV